MIGKFKYELNQFLIRIYRRHFGKGLNPIYLIKSFFEMTLFLLVLALLIYFLLPEGIGK